MSIVPVSRLAASDLAHLGHNILPAVRHDRDELLAAVNRSLASIGESFDEPVPPTRAVLSKPPSLRR